MASLDNPTSTTPSTDEELPRLLFSKTFLACFGLVNQPVRGNSDIDKPRKRSTVARNTRRKNARLLRVAKELLPPAPDPAARRREEQYDYGPVELPGGEEVYIDEEGAVEGFMWAMEEEAAAEQDEHDLPGARELLRDEEDGGDIIEEWEDMEVEAERANAVPKVAQGNLQNRPQQEYFFDSGPERLRLDDFIDHLRALPVHPTCERVQHLFRRWFPLCTFEGDLDCLDLFHDINIPNAIENGIVIFQLQCPPPTEYTPTSRHPVTHKWLDNGPTSRFTRPLMEVVAEGTGAEVAVLDSMNRCAGKHMREKATAEKGGVPPTRRCFPSQVMCGVAAQFKQIIEIILDGMGIKILSTFASGKIAHVTVGAVNYASPMSSSFHVSNLQPSPTRNFTTQPVPPAEDNTLTSAPIFPSPHWTHPLSVKDPLLSAILFLQPAIQVATCVKMRKGAPVATTVEFGTLEDVKKNYQRLTRAHRRKLRSFDDLLVRLRVNPDVTVEDLWAAAAKERAKIVARDRGFKSYFSSGSRPPCKKLREQNSKIKSIKFKSTAVINRAGQRSFDGGAAIGCMLNALVRDEDEWRDCGGLSYDAPTIRDRSPPVHGYGLASTQRAAWLAGHRLIEALSLLEHLKRTMYMKAAATRKRNRALDAAGIPREIESPYRAAARAAREAAFQSGSRPAPARTRPVIRNTTSPIVTPLSAIRLEEIAATNTPMIILALKTIVKIDYRDLVPYLKSVRINKTDRTTLGNHWDRFVKWKNWPKDITSNWMFSHSYQGMSRAVARQLLEAVESGRTYLRLRSPTDIAARVQQTKDSLRG